MAKRVVILGALSAIAVAAGRLYAAEGAELVLVGRREDELLILAADLTLRGAANVRTLVLDLAMQASPESLNTVFAGGADVILLAYGTLTDQSRAERDPRYAAAQLQTNFVSAALWCLAAASVLEQANAGVLIVIGSVAADRGRKSNYVYGAAKAGLGVLCQGIAHRLAPTGARTILIKPGLIDTPMTAHLPKTGFLWAKPEAVARTIVKSTERRRSILYTPPFWRLVLLIIRLIPAPIFRRLDW